MSTDDVLNRVKRNRTLLDIIIKRKGGYNTTCYKKKRSVSNCACGHSVRVRKKLKLVGEGGV